ncbi:MAG: GIY-YIG nuclease family protein [Candidatus Omnitrophota bacterium]
MKEYYVYIMASRSGVLYIGVTNNLSRRVYEHKKELIPGFSQKYKTKKLVYFENCGQIIDTIAREKQLKRWRREKKDDLIKTINPTLSDLSRSFDCIPTGNSAQDDKSDGSG